MCEGKQTCFLQPGNLNFNPRVACNGWPRMWITYSCDGTSIDTTQVRIPPRPRPVRRRPPPRRPPPRRPRWRRRRGCFSENSIVETKSGKKVLSSLSMYILYFLRYLIILFSSWGFNSNLQVWPRKDLYQGKKGSVVDVSIVCQFIPTSFW